MAAKQKMKRPLFDLPKFRKGTIVKVSVLGIIGQVDAVSREKNNYYYYVGGIPYAESELVKV